MEKAMSQMSRRTLLHAFGIASVAPFRAIPDTETGRVVIVKPDENRFSFGSPRQAWLTPCKLTSEDSAGTLSIFELNVRSRTGTVLHVHHREDEWFYVLSGEFIFEAGNGKYSLGIGSSILLPRGIPHLLANTGEATGKLIAVCRPGGFEKFLNELGSTPEGQMNGSRMKEVMERYGMEYLGPPLFGAWREH